MGLFLIRVFFIVICTVTAFMLAEGSPLLMVVLGFIGGMFIVLFESFSRKISLKGLSSVVFGMVLGLILAKIFGYFLDVFNIEPELNKKINIFFTFTAVYLGATLGLKGKEEFNIVIPYVKFRRQEIREDLIVIDTSVIIDGRILDIVKTGFIEGKFIVPRIVLNELHNLSDSTDHMKRQRGKRGIEILHSLKQLPNIDVIIHEDESKQKGDVDSLLVKLAQYLDAKILTTDYNLNRIASLEGVKVLNINDLVNALKPILLPGERFSLKLVKEGKEHNQAIGYLDDGTMVVVENARWLIGKTVEVEVTSVLQNPSGRIIFTKVVG